ncbi:MAG: hypothetical protein NTW29_05335 [Bacteroidetes bacterium]|nr:hypothetical protein [Bacteroidota bacterium]
MKYCIVILGIICLSACSDSVTEKKSVAPVEPSFTEIISTFDKAQDSLAGRDTSNQLEYLNRKFLADLISKKDSIFQYPYTMENGIKFAFSPDRNVAIVSWNTWMGGTMLDFIAVLFYKEKDSIGHQIITYPGEEDLGSSYCWYDTIAMVQEGNNKIYLAHGYGRGSTALWWENLVAYTYIKGTLQRAALFPVFDEIIYGEVSDTLTDQIFLELDTHYTDKTIWTDRPGISFINTGKKLKVPLITPEGGNTKYYHILEFDGKKYQIQSRVSD